MLIEPAPQLLESFVGRWHRRMVRTMRALVACFGNLLRGDDGFGPAVARRMLERDLPPGVRVIDVGIGGIHLVHELLDPLDLLIVVDAINRGRPAGTVMVIRPDIVDVQSLSATERRDQLADMHYATPERALMLASALGVLPAETWLVGCEPLDADRVGQGLSEPVSAAIEIATTEVHRLIEEAQPATGDGRARPA